MCAGVGYALEHSEYTGFAAILQFLALMGILWFYSKVYSSQERDVKPSIDSIQQKLP